MAAILPQEVTDEPLRSIRVAGRRHERMLNLARDATHVEQSVAPFRPLEVNRGDVQPVTEQKVGRRRVAVQPDLLIGPHRRLVPPQPL